MRPTFFVFCEGKSEEAYVKYLRSKYRLPIEIDPNVAGLSISKQHISNYKKGKDVDPKLDKDFLMYDLDRDDILPRLQTIGSAIIIASNPCIELWYLLHCKNQTSELTSNQCNETLSRYIKTYDKGTLCPELLLRLGKHLADARHRAQKLTPLSNPSTNMYRFLDELERAKQ